MSVSAPPEHMKNTAEVYTMHNDLLYARVPAFV
jgi:hypothetical protein